MQISQIFLNVTISTSSQFTFESPYRLHSAIVSGYFPHVNSVLTHLSGISSLYLWTYVFAGELSKFDRHRCTMSWRNVLDPFPPVLVLILESFTF